MTITVTGNDQTVYQNKTNRACVVTVVASGRATVELKGTSPTASASLPVWGGAVSFEVPPQHRIDVTDLVSEGSVNVELFGFCLVS